MKSSNQRQTYAFGYLATGFIQTLYFDVEFNYVGGSVEQVSIGPDAPDNWESESCKSIPYVRYEYTRVSKKNPETRRSSQARINQAREKIKFFASVATTKGSVLRIVKETVVARFQPNVKAIFDITLSYLEESYGSLISDTIASLRKTRDIPSHLKKMGKAASKKSASKSSKRRVK
jgi:hypothetical protein